MNDDFKAKAKAALEKFRTKTGGCYGWTGAKVTKGYGACKINGKQHQAHILAYELSHGPVPKGKMVGHTCNTPACSNPRHLYAVTNTQNQQQRRAQGR